LHAQLTADRSPWRSAEQREIGVLETVLLTNQRERPAETETVVGGTGLAALD
jgi:hypothetical protein